MSLKILEYTLFLLCSCWCLLGCNDSSRDQQANPEKLSVNYPDATEEEKAILDGPDDFDTKLRKLGAGKIIEKGSAAKWGEDLTTVIYLTDNKDLLKQSRKITAVTDKIENIKKSSINTITKGQDYYLIPLAIYGFEKNFNGNDIEIIFKLLSSTGREVLSYDSLTISKRMFSRTSEEPLIVFPDKPIILNVPNEIEVGNYVLLSTITDKKNNVTLNLRTDLIIQ